MIHLMAELKATPGCEQPLETLLRGLLEPTREEPGCCQYELFQDSEDSGLFVMQEIWCSRKSLEQHLGSEHFRQFQQNSQALLEFVKMRPLNFIG